MREPAYLKMNPNGLVPVLRDGDVAMFESNAIVRYLAARYGEGNLLPTGAEGARRGRAMDGVAAAQCRAARLGDLHARGAHAARRSAIDKAIADAEAACQDVLPIADQALAHRAWFAGDSFSFGDIVLGRASTGATVRLDGEAAGSCPTSSAGSRRCSSGRPIGNGSWSRSAATPRNGHAT